MNDRDKFRVYRAIGWGERSPDEIAGRCNLTPDEVKKICWEGVKIKEIRYEKYNGVEVFGNTLHYYLTKEGRRELKILSLEQRITNIENEISKE